MRTAHERCRRFDSAPLGLSPAQALAHVEARCRGHRASRGPSTVTPPMPSCVIGRRTRTRGLLHRPPRVPRLLRPATDDATGTVLARVLAGIVPVFAGINLEYYFSLVDNAGYGCGTKLPHNVTALLGVMDGHASDLRTGLPWQMVEIHEPVRVLIVVEATPDRSRRIIAANDDLARLLQNRWIQMAAWNSATAELASFTLRGLRAAPPRRDGAAAGARSVARLVRRPARVPALRVHPSVTMDALTVSGLAVVTAPASLLGVLGATGLAGRPLGERTVGAACGSRSGSRAWRSWRSPPPSCTAAAGRSSSTAGPGSAHRGIGSRCRLLFDRLSIAFAALTIGLGGAVGVFAERYLHREPGYHRFFLLLALFISGLLLTTLAATIELVYAGWELVGLSSALLIAFFHERPEPVRNGLRAFVVYRGCDAGLLAAAVLVHHWAGTGDLTVVLGAGSWPGAGVSIRRAGHARRRRGPDRGDGQVGAGAALGLAAARVEGPTPSSAIFYGALSVHAGAYLLLRIGPLLDRAPVVAALVVVVGLATALHATLVARVQTDIKCALAYASLTQVGIIFVEIGFGLRLLALAHIAGHACLRSLQFLRTPSLLHDFHQVDNAVGGHLIRACIHLERSIPSTLQRRMYVWALERGGLDAWLDAFVVRPFVRTAGAFDRLERRWTARLGRSEDTGSAP